MPACPTCAADLSADALVCPRCSTPTPWSSDVTHLAADVAETARRIRGTRGHQTDPDPRTPRDPRLSLPRDPRLTTTDIDHGRFPPGTVLDGRYRVVGRLGRGGMGEVYRADDLKLGQPVALKFLPESVDRDPARLTQLHTEVRLARQVSHPNVCRVYDVGEYEGHTFLSMEYVDGEDLSTLLRRIGRFPQDRAIELARQMCAGLAAAHDRGIVHRDLKPANIMLDGGGRIRITDFGLAGAAGETIRAGTPAYMAPEQLAGTEVTPRSDVYSLGLVLYELFTGRRALEGENLAEIIAKREQGGITQPSDIVRDLDPAIDRAVMRCLDPDPVRRPPSALAVAAALPGGDPLAAALAAGETPSPEMVAAAGTTSALKPLPAFAALGGALALLGLCAVLMDRVLVTSLIPMPKPPVLLVDRAKQILESIGQRPGVDAGWGFMPANFLGWIGRHPELGMRERLASGTPAALQFWYRGSPTVMVPSADHDAVTLDDPAFNVSGMSEVVLDPQGRLIRLAIVPPQVDPAAGPPPPPPDWKVLFDAAGVDMRAFTPAAPTWTPRMFADQRLAWTGPMPGLPRETLRLEGGSYRGKPVYFHPVTPWSTTSRMSETITARSRVTFMTALIQMVIFAMFAAAALIARHNVRRGRGDKRGAWQLSGAVLVAAIGVWLITNKHVADPAVEMTRFFVGQPLWAIALLWLLYMAVEPYMRRFWPATLVSWSRLMARQWRDPLVGRDVLFGIALGLTVRALAVTSTYLGARLGYPWTPETPDLSELLGTGMVVARVLNQVFNTVLNAIFAVFAMVLLKMLVKRERVASALAIALAMLLAVRGINEGGSALVNAVAAVVMVSIVVLTIQRLGLVATMMLFLVNFVMSSGVIALDPSKWFFGESMLLIALPAAMAIYGFYASRGGEPLFGRRLLD